MEGWWSPSKPGREATNCHAIDHAMDLVWEHNKRQAKEEKNLFKRRTREKRNTDAFAHQQMEHVHQDIKEHDLHAKDAAEALKVSYLADSHELKQWHNSRKALADVKEHNRMETISDFRDSVLDLQKHRARKKSFEKKQEIGCNVRAQSTQLVTQRKVQQTTKLENNRQAVDLQRREKTQMVSMAVKDTVHQRFAEARSMRTALTKGELAVRSKEDRERRKHEVEDAVNKVTEIERAAKESQEALAAKRAADAFTMRNLHSAYEMMTDRQRVLAYEARRQNVDTMREQTKLEMEQFSPQVQHDLAKSVQRRRRGKREGMQRAKREEMQRTKRLQDEAAAEAKAEHEEAKVEPVSQGGWSWW